MVKTIRNLLLAAALSCSVSAQAAQLLMVEQAGCPGCARFNAEIGSAEYGAAEAARIAPLRRVDAWNWPRDLRKIGQTRFTPVFILVEDGREVGRFHGYVNERLFWGNLDRLLQELPASQPSCADVSRSPAEFTAAELARACNIGRG